MVKKCNSTINLFPTSSQIALFSLPKPANNIDFLQSALGIKRNRLLYSPAKIDRNEVNVKSEIPTHRTS